MLNKNIIKIAFVAITHWKCSPREARLSEVRVHVSISRIYHQTGKIIAFPLIKQFNKSARLRLIVLLSSIFLKKHDMNAPRSTERSYVNLNFHQTFCSPVLVANNNISKIVNQK